MLSGFKFLLILLLRRSNFNTLDLATVCILIKLVSNIALSLSLQDLLSTFRNLWVIGRTGCLCSFLAFGYFDLRLPSLFLCGFAVVKALVNWSSKLWLLKLCLSLDHSATFL